MATGDVIWLELNAKLSLKIYFINPGDEVFAPLNVWPVSPQQKTLSKTNEFTEIRLTKKSKISNRKKNDCNSSPDYVYGGTLITAFRKF